MANFSFTLRRFKAFLDYACGPLKRSMSASYCLRHIHWPKAICVMMSECCKARILFIELSLAVSGCCNVKIAFSGFRFYHSVEKHLVKLINLVLNYR